MIWVSIKLSVVFQVGFFSSENFATKKKEKSMTCGWIIFSRFKNLFLLLLLQIARFLLFSSFNYSYHCLINLRICTYIYIFFSHTISSVCVSNQSFKQLHSDSMRDFIECFQPLLYFIVLMFWLGDSIETNPKLDSIGHLNIHGSFLKYQHYRGRTSSPYVPRWSG